MEPRQTGSGGGIEGVPALSGSFESLPLSERQIEDGNEARPEHRNEVGAVQAEVASLLIRERDLVLGQVAFEQSGIDRPREYRMDDRRVHVNAWFQMAYRHLSFFAQ